MPEQPEKPLPLPAPSDFSPVPLNCEVIDLRVMMPRWQAKLAEIKRLFRERYPDAEQIGGA